jgi:hypothetical protein
MAGGAATFSRKELRNHCGWSLTQVRVHLERLVELECLAIRHGRLGSQFVYEMLLDTDTTEAVAHIGLIDTAFLRTATIAHNDQTQRAGDAANLTRGGETPPPAENTTPTLLKTQPDGLTPSRIRGLRTATGKKS